MILPKVKSYKNKIRNAKIIRLWAQDLYTMEEIGKRFKITASRVGQIIYNNRDLLDRDKKYEKARRIVELERMYRNAPNTQKDKADLLEQIRKEFEGDSNINFISQFLNITPNNLSPENRLNALQSNK